MNATEGVGTPTLQNFYVTFGVKYDYEVHPHWPDAHPYGWLRIQAPDYGTARDLVEKYIGNVFAFMYEEDRFRKEAFERGELACITPDGVVRVKKGVGTPTLLAETTTKLVRVSWYETTHYTYTIEVPADFDLEQDDADEVLEQRICELDEADLDGAFTGTTDRQVTEKRWAS